MSDLDLADLRLDLVPEILEAYRHQVSLATITQKYGATREQVEALLSEHGLATWRDMRAADKPARDRSRARTEARASQRTGQLSGHSDGSPGSPARCSPPTSRPSAT